VPRGWEGKKARQPPFILLDRNIDAAMSTALADVAAFRQIGKGETGRFRHDATDLEIYQGQRRFLFVTHDQGFLRPDHMPSNHGGMLVCVVRPGQAAAALRRFLDWWGPKRNLLRNRVFRLTATGGAEVLRDGTTRRIYRQPDRTHSASYGGSARS
jgi:hypothetical protein